MERWLKNLNRFKQEINPRNVDHGNIKKIKISKKSAKNHRKDTKARVDKHPLISYIQDMKEKTITITVDGTNPGQWSNLLLELNIMKKAWRSFGVSIDLKAPGIRNIIEWGNRTGDYVRPNRQNSKRLQQNKRSKT